MLDYESHLDQTEVTEAKRAAHPGFQAVQSKIAKSQGISKDAAGRILGAASRRANKAARAKNPRLNRVKGK